MILYDDQDLVVSSNSDNTISVNCAEYRIVYYPSRFLHIVEFVEDEVKVYDLINPDLIDYLFEDLNNIEKFVKQFKIQISKLLKMKVYL